MAVVQLSKIQIRRGQKNTGSGLPQLASGELGWAIDTRELYIGNGAVSEGAPAVGNTKILTQYDDLFSLANTYSYKQDEDFLTGANSSAPVQRTLQERLDDRVSVRAFGAVGDGVTDDTGSLQRAIDQLYLSSSKGNPSSRVKLHFEAGTYKITDTLYVPANATLLGAGKDKTVIRLESATAKPVIKTVNDSSTPGNPAGIETSTFLNQPRNITVTGFTLEQTTVHTGFLLEACRDSSFADLKIEGSWNTTSNQGGEPYPRQETGIILDALSGAVSSDSNYFERIEITKFSWAIRSDWDIKYNHFTTCKFSNLGTGVALGENLEQPGTQGQQTGPTRNIIEQSQFDTILRWGLYIVKGTTNTSENNSYNLVANNNANDKSPVFPVVKFFEKGNNSINDWFSRTQALISGPGLNDVAYVPEIDGAVSYGLSYEQEATISNTGNTTGDAASRVRLFRLPAYQDLSYDIDYTIASDDFSYMRSGVLTITMLNVIDGVVDERVEISDNYSWVGNEQDDFINFMATLHDYGTSNAEPTTIAIRYNAALPDPNGTAKMKFTISAKKTNFD